MTAAASMKEAQLTEDCQLGFSQVDKLLHKLTWSGMRRLAKINFIQPYEDMYQEVFIVYLVAKKSYDASRNVRFTTYLQTCVQNFFSDYINRHFNQATQTESLDEDDTAFEAVDTAMTPETHYVASCNLEIANRELSSLSKLVLFTLIYPSKEVLEAHAKSGGNSAMDVNFTTRYILSTRPALKNITEEQLKMLVKRVCDEFRKTTKKIVNG